MAGARVASDEWRVRVGGRSARQNATKPPTRRVLCYATAKLLRDEAESMVPSIDPGQVRKLAGGG